MSAPSTAKQKMLSVLNAMAGRSRLLSRMAGMQYGGKRDIYAVAGYPKEPQFTDFWAQYTRGDVAGRIVDMPAKTTWRTPPEIWEKDNRNDTPFTDAFGVLAKRLRLWSYFQRVDRLAGIGRYAVLFIGVKGAEDRQLKLPVEKVRGPEDILYLSVYHEANAQIVEWETDPGSERFGLPKIYRLQIASNQQAFARGNLEVHASRIIHVAEDVLEDDVYGRPRLERPFNRLFDLDKVAASTGEAYWQIVSRILQAKIDPEMEVDKADLDVLDEKLGAMVHDLRRQFYGQGVELSWLGGETPNVSQVAEFYFSLIAGATGYPKRILFGSEMGELASSQDQANYYGIINERQEQFAEPVILRQFVDRLITWGALPEPTDEYQVQWPPLYEESDKDRAQASLARAQAAAALTPVGGNPRELVEIDEESNVWLVQREPDEPMELPLPGELDPLHDGTDTGDPNADPNADPSADPNADAPPGVEPPPAE